MRRIDWMCSVAGFLLLLLPTGCRRQEQVPKPGRAQFELTQPAASSPSEKAPPAVPTKPAQPGSQPAAPSAQPAAAASAEAAPADEGQGLAVVLASKLNVRLAPVRLAGNVLRTLSCGDVVEVEGRGGEEGAWYKLRIDKASGFAHSAYLARLGAGGKVPLCQFSFLRSKRTRHKESEDATLPNVPQINQEQAAALAEAKAAPEPEPVGPTTQPAPPVPPTPEATAKAAVPKPDTPVATTPPVVATPAAKPVPSAAPIDRGAASLILAKDSSRARPVEFSHRSHQSRYACFRCHHPVDTSDGKIQKVAGVLANSEKNCHTCHKTPATTQVRATNQDAFHTQCRDCHRVEGGSAPTGCKDCHQ